ncbi:MAG: hypothetical protein ABFD77_01520 [Thermotogota bacterium]
MSARREAGGNGRRLLEWGVLVLAAVVGASVSAPGITVSVSEFSLVVGPGSNLEVRFTVLNDENSPLRVDISPCDWDEDPDGVTRLSRSGTLERSCATWLALSAPTYVLRPADEVEVSCGISVPAGVAGTYWAGLLVAVSPVDAGPEESGIRVAREFLVKIYVTSLPAAQGAAVTRVTALGLSPLTIEFSVANRGETRLDDVLGTLSIQSPSGATLAETSLPHLSILPGHSVDAVVKTPWSLLDSGMFLVRTVIDFGGDYLVAGQIILRVPELTLVPLGTFPRPPQDVNRDGLFEDIDGDGDLDGADVALFEASLDLPAVRNNVRAFDFDNDGILTTADITALLGRVLSIP